MVRMGVRTRRRRAHSPLHGSPLAPRFLRTFLWSPMAEFRAQQNVFYCVLLNYCLSTELVAASVSMKFMKAWTWPWPPFTLSPVLGFQAPRVHHCAATMSFFVGEQVILPFGEKVNGSGGARPRPYSLGSLRNLMGGIVSRPRPPLTCGVRAEFLG